MLEQQIDDRWISLEDAASYMDVTKDTVRNLIKKTDILKNTCFKFYMIFLLIH